MNDYYETYDYKSIDATAEKLGQDDPRFWEYANRLDSSAFYHDPPRDGWDQFSKDKHYQYLLEAIQTYRPRTQKHRDKQGQPCQYFLQNRCKFGSQCKYAHVTSTTTQSDIKDTVSITGEIESGKS